MTRAGLAAALALLILAGCAGDPAEEAAGPACGDGHVDAGEACDDGNATAGDGCEADCTVTPAPADGDADGVPDAEDNCPVLANPDQTDLDQDHKGDGCDPCPLEANLGTTGCPVTIYQLKDGSISDGTRVQLRNALVTAVAATGFFVQVRDGDLEYAGLWVHATPGAVAPGDRLTFPDATRTTYFGQVQLVPEAPWQVVSHGDSLPAPFELPPGDLATGGPGAGVYEGVLVMVRDVTVTDVAPAPGSGEVAPTWEYEVTGTLRVDDLLFRPAALPAVGTAFASITGVLAFRNENSKLLPRSAADLVPQ